MALETLIRTQEIDGFRVVHADKERDAYNPSHRNNFVIVDNDENTITFKIQKGPVKEVGVNGCQVDTLVDAAITIISELDKKFPCDDNRRAMSCLETGLFWLKQRRKNRELRGVEGTSQK